MRNLFILVVLQAYWLTTCAQTPTCSLQINIAGIRNNDGKILCSVFKEGIGYPDRPEQAFYKASIPIKDRKAIFDIEVLPPGRYAVALLHDENGDNKMNTSMVGLPKEGYGFSNNVMGLFGPPAYSKASFDLSPDRQKKIQINLRY